MQIVKYAKNIANKLLYYANIVLINTINVL